MKKFTKLEEELIKENAQIQQNFDTYYKLASSQLEEVKIGLNKLKTEFYGDPATKKANESYINSIKYATDTLDQILDHLMWEELEEHGLGALKPEDKDV